MNPTPCWCVKCGEKVFEKMPGEHRPAYVRVQISYYSGRETYSHGKLEHTQLMFCPDCVDHGMVNVTMDKLLSENR